ncbi:MAG TPA: type IV pilus biogenesis/stability protein PilW [Casimicrobiaceae bacterium]
MTPPVASAVFGWRALLAALALTLIAGCATKQTVVEAPQVTALPAPQPESPQVRAQIHTDLGAGYYQRGQMDVALEELNTAIKIDPTYAKAYNIFGLVYAVLGEDRKAEQSFAQALKLAPDDSDIHHNWGWYLCQHGREREALVEFESAVRNPLYRTPEIALVNAGRCSQPFDERAAEGYYRRALAAQPGNPLASLGLAQIAYKGRRYQEARTWMRGVMLTNNPPPEGLRLGMCIERKLGDRQAELSYVSQLRNRYPDAAETRGLATDTCE